MRSKMRSMTWRDLSTSPWPQVATGGWQAVKDATGRTYFWNKETNTTSWDPPPGF